MATPTCGTWKNLTTTWKDTQDGTNFTDPVMGNLFSNCFLAAALSSIAFSSYYRSLAKTPLLSKYSITIFDGSFQYTIKMTTTQLVDSVGEFPGIHSKTPTLEAWPACYEKAYAAYLIDKAQYPGGRTVTLSLADNVNVGTFNPCLVWAGNGFTALQKLIGSASGTDRHLKDVNGNVIVPDTTVVNDLTVVIASQFGTTTSYQVLKPTVAWTYYNTTSSFVGYNYNLRIAANHTYSLLGMVLGNSGANTYIILRDPCGQNSNQEPITQWCDYEVGKNGIIAVSMDEFYDAFEAYGWVA